MPAFTPRQLVLLVLLTLIWGVNWPVMKLGVTHFPPLSFRALAMWLGVLVVWVVLRVQRQPLRVPRDEWRTLGLLAFFNMVIWNSLVIVAIPWFPAARCHFGLYHAYFFSSAGQPDLARPPEPACMGRGRGLCRRHALLWHELGRWAATRVAFADFAGRTVLGGGHANDAPRPHANAVAGHGL